MYLLSDFSREELNVLAVLIQRQLDETSDEIQRIEQCDFSGKTLSTMLRPHIRLNSILKELNVRVLTSRDMIKQRETTNAN